MGSLLSSWTWNTRLILERRKHEETSCRDLGIWCCYYCHLFASLLAVQWHTKWKEHLHLDVFTSGFYILVAFIAYGFIFQRYRQSVALRKRTTSYGNNRTDPRTAFSFKTRIFIPVMSILTFILFYLVPVLLGAIKFETAKNYRIPAHSGACHYKRNRHFLEMRQVDSYIVACSKIFGD